MTRALARTAPDARGRTLRLDEPRRRLAHPSTPRAALDIAISSRASNA